MLVKVCGLLMLLLSLVSTALAQDAEIQVDSRTGTAYGLAWNPDGTILAVASGYELTLFTADLDSVLTTVTEPRPGVGFLNVAWRPDGKQLATVSGYRNPDILMWDWDADALSLEPATTLAGDDPDIPAAQRAHHQYGLSWGESGLISLTDDRDATFQFWDTEAETVIGFHDSGYTAPLYQFTWSENDLAMIAVGQESDTENFAILAMDAEKGNTESLYVLPEQPSAVGILNDSIMALAYPDGRIEIISLGITVHTFMSVDQPVSLDWNGTLLAVLGYETDLQIWDLAAELP
jgi:WD40 repeat protein